MKITFMKKRRILFTVFGLMMVWGLVLEQHLDLLYYARTLCLSCIGID
ncbi:MAG: hypothetical protein J7L90_03765 [Dehalococcoidia bacterium]|nr:hypothetical protein [Dehalococcoidia bacterium]